MSKDQKLQQARAQLVNSLTRAADERSLDLMRQLAREIVALRRLFHYDGRPDWAGRSQDYRDTIYRAYRDAKIPSDSTESLQANLRYHVGNVVREVAPAEDLAALGMNPQGPRGRASQARRVAKGTRGTNMSAPGAEREETPEFVLAELRDAGALASFALDALRAIRELRPRGEDARSVVPTVREITEECLNLMAELRIPLDRRRRLVSEIQLPS